MAKSALLFFFFSSRRRHTRLQGDWSSDVCSSDLPLSALGRLQAAAVGQSLRNSGIRRIVHSPLDRARETAELVNAQLPTPVPLIPEPALREAEIGRYLQGVPYWQIPFRRPRWFVHKLRRGSMAGDETIEQLGGRVRGVVQRLAREHPGEVSLCVSHADPLLAAWLLVEGRPQTERELYAKSLPRAGMPAEAPAMDPV